ncbi:MAG: hypothetical protein KGP14_09140 [Betaproteobacteria bacterium]|nr:hypothetical protein [Betaproteobacteria bacterium]
MNLRIFNAALLIGWLMALVGGLLYDIALGLIGGGLLLLMITACVVRLGGIFMPRPTVAEETDVPE